MGTERYGAVFSELVERCSPFIKATSYKFERKVRSVPENFITVKNSAVMYGKDDFENVLLLQLYKLMLKVMEDSDGIFKDKSAENIARIFCTSGIGLKELVKMVQPHESEKLSAFSFDDDENGRELSDENHDIADTEFKLSMESAMKNEPDSRVIYDLVVNQPWEFISWCETYSGSQKRNRMVDGDIPQSYMRQYLIEQRGWTKHRFETALRVLRTTTKEVTAV